MKTKVIGLFLCMLFIAAMVPTVESFNNTAIKVIVPNVPKTSMTGNWTEIQKLLASDGATGDAFGCRVSLDGNTALIGAVYDDDKGADSGSAYVFTRTGTTWTQQAKLLASDGAAGDSFGMSVSLSGNTALIGTPDDDWNRGSAYVFTRSGTTWTQQQKLHAPDGATTNFFGQSVSLDGDTVLIGAYMAKSAYVFTRTDVNWTYQAKLLAGDTPAHSNFGVTVSLSGDTALIGDYINEHNGTDSGSAYVFTRTGTTWTQQAKLLSSDSEALDCFGCSVSLSGDTALIGAPAYYSSSHKTGVAYVFTRTGTIWTQQQKLTASDGAIGDQFGQIVFLTGDTALIGAVGDDGNKGSVYVFTRTSSIWTQQQKLTASDGGSGDKFCIVTVDGDTALIGALYDDDKGSVYVFTREGENQPPATPTITGPAKGKVKVATEYNFTSTDPEGHEVYYFIDWGDQTNSSWIGSYPSGDVITKPHTWSKKGPYTIKAKAKDIYGNESDWGMLSVTMPCSYNIPFLSFWERLLERFPHAFPILRHLLGY